MKFKSLIVLCYLFALVLLVSSTAEVEKSKEETNEDKAQEEYHVNNAYGVGGWDGYGGGGYGGPGGGWGGGGYGGPGGGWGGYNGGWGRRGGGYGGGWGGRGRGYGGWGGRGGGYGGWGGRGRGGWGCPFGCCGGGRGYCSRCCYSLTEAMAFNEQEATP